MINWNDTNLLWAQPRDILTASINLVAEGQAMVSAFEAGVPKVTMSTGNTADSFIGIAHGPRRTFSTNVKIETVTVPAVAPYTVLLTHTTNAAPGAFVVGGAQVAVSNGPSSPTNVSYGTDATTGLTALTFDASFAGQTFTIPYSYVMGITEEQGLYGNPNPGFAAEQVLGSMIVGILGNYSTNDFSPTANWYAGGGIPKVKVIAGGIFTDAGNAAPGIIPASVNVLSLPSASNPWLRLELK